MSKFNDTTPKSKFEDVPEEILNDPVLRTALGMDPIPGMNTPVDAANNICNFVNEHSGMDLKATQMNKSTDNTTSGTTSLTLLEEQQFLDKTIRVFGTVEDPLFLARDVAEWLDYSKNKDGSYKVDVLLKSVDADEKINIMTPPYNVEGALKTNTVYSFLTENGLYEVLMLSRKPQAKSFRKKVKEILKSIRKNGAYIRNQENLTPEEIVARGLIAAQNIINEKEKEIAVLNGRCGLLTQAVDEKQDIINAISRNVPAPTKRAMLNRVMRRKCPGLAQSRWTFLYGKFEEIYHMNLKARMKKYNADPSHKKCKTILEFIDVGLGMMDELYDLAVKLFVSDFKQLAKELHLICMTDEEYMSADTLREILN